MQSDGCSGLDGEMLSGLPAELLTQQLAVGANRIGKCCDG
jgi:hypothetical protein